MCAGNMRELLIERFFGDLIENLRYHDFVAVNYKFAIAILHLPNIPKSLKKVHFGK